MNNNEDKLIYDKRSIISKVCVGVGAILGLLVILTAVYLSLAELSTNWPL